MLIHAGVNALVTLISHSDQIDDIFHGDEGILKGSHKLVNKILYSYGTLTFGMQLISFSPLNSRTSKRCNHHYPLNHTTCTYQEVGEKSYRQITFNMHIVFVNVLLYSYTYINGLLNVFPHVMYLMPIYMNLIKI